MIFDDLYYLLMNLRVEIFINKYEIILYRYRNLGIIWTPIS